MQKEVMEKINATQLVLIGLGEEFDDLKRCKENPIYVKGRSILENSDKTYLLPAYDDYFREERKAEVKSALQNLINCIKDKNYFVVTTSVNSAMQEMDWKEERFTAPCGNALKKQCIHGCSQGLKMLSESERALLKQKITEFTDAVKEDREYDLAEFDELFGICPECGTPLILNNIYTEFYDEKGYLDSWQTYRTWLQGTMNRNVVILELGVGLQCPSVIRFPFEKMAFYNQKASFYRVHETLYQLAEDLQGKGTSISKNSIDWLQFLC